MKRTIIAEGDANNVVTRTARKYAAKATIRTESGEELILWVDLYGNFTLHRHTHGALWRSAVPLVAGTLGNSYGSDEPDAQTLADAEDAMRLIGGADA